MLRFKNILKLTVSLGIFLFILWGVSFVLQWQSPEVNNEVAEDIENCLYKSDYKSLKLNSIEGIFNVSYIENANKSCLNPSFPIIHIKTGEEHNAWLR